MSQPLSRRFKSLKNAKAGIRSLLTRSLGLSLHDELLVILDESHIKESILIADVASRLGITVSCLLVPASAQCQIKSEATLPGITREAIRHCQAMIVLIDYSAGSTPFRMATLRYFTDLRKSGRAASMPGVSLQELHYADSDHEEIDRVATSIAHLLLRTRIVTIKTDDGRQGECILKIPLASFPTICGSVIERGDWDNVPSGETFVLPRRNAANGRVAISGSLPGIVLEHRPPVILDIKNGKLVNVTCEDNKVGEQARGLFFKPGLRAPISRNAHILSELGFGVNRSIERFHGSPIFDEKMFGTVHVAFGRNDQLGGKIKGFSHHDLTVSRPTVFLDCHRGAPVIENRKFLLSERDIELDWSELKPRLENHWRVSPSGLHCSYEPKTNGLVMEWMQCAGPKASTRVGNLETSILAGVAYHYLTEPMTVEVLVEKLRGDDISRGVALAAIEVLRSYKIANISRT